MYYTKDGSAIKPRPWHEKAVKMALKGHGATKIAQKLLGRKSQESTVRDFLSKLDLTKSEPVMDRLKVLFWDIETSPALSAHWGLYDQTISKGATVRSAGMLSHAWAWNDGQVYSSVLTPKEAIKNDYERIVREAWSLLDNADVVVGQNCKSFDIKRMMSEFIKLDLPPPSPFKVYDTLRVAKRHFNFERNDLDSLCVTLNIPYRKVKHEGLSLWMKCIQGDQEALDQMQEYNVGDIPTLRAVFKKLLPWDNQGVNFALMGENLNGCPNCGENSLESTGKFTYTNARKYGHYRCKHCGANARATRGEGGLTFTRVTG